MSLKNMILFNLSIITLLHVVVSQVTYDAYFGKPLTNNRRDLLIQANATRACTIEVQPCKKDEGRRVDGTCVNPRYPSRGGTATPLLRMLPARFGLGNSLRPAQNGSDLPSSRVIRTKILTEGYTEDHQFSTLLTHVFVFSFIDHVDLNYLLGFTLVSDCCAGNTPNRVDPRCIPIPVPQDDPILRHAGIRCMNVSRFITYQDRGCIPNTLPSERYSSVPPLLDLSVIYGNTEERNKQIRANRTGLLLAEETNGKEYPPPTSPWCIRNQRPRENACYDFGDNYNGNTLAGVYLTALWFFREHNRLARNLARINPCWTDDRLFQTARQINIAQWQYIMYYEVISALLGRNNAMRAGIIYETAGYVDDFDSRIKPGVYHEYVTGCRWFHTLQDGRTDLYSNRGKYLGTRTTVDDALRSGILEVNNTEADLTQGAFRQPAARIDWNLDYDMAEQVFGGIQAVGDIGAIDMQRGRDAGFPPYNEYRKTCGLPEGHDWEDFTDTMWPDKVEQLRRVYGSVEDVDLMAAIYSERLVPGSSVGPTLLCIMTRNLVEMRRADRHFFEHGDHPAALTLPQLNEIRKTSIARLLCDNGDKVDRIQPYAAYVAGMGNEKVPCERIPGINLNQWQDPVCTPARDKQDQTSEKQSINPDNISKWVPRNFWTAFNKNRDNSNILYPWSGPYYSNK